MRRADDGVGARGLVVEDLGRAHVDHLHVALVVDHHVFRFQVAIDNLVVVKVLNRQNQLPDIELRVIGVQQPDLAYHVKKLHPLDVLDQKIDILVVDIRPVEVHDEGVVHFGADLTLLRDILLHLLFLDLPLVDHLDGVLLGGLCFSVFSNHEVDHAELALAELSDKDQLLHLDRLGLLHDRVVVLLPLILVVIAVLLDHVLQRPAKNLKERLEIDLAKRPGLFDDHIALEAFLLVFLDEVLRAEHLLRLVFAVFSRVEEVAVEADYH